MLCRDSCDNIADLEELFASSPCPIPQTDSKSNPSQEPWALRKNGKFSEYGKYMYKKEIGWVEYCAWSDGASEAEEKEGK